MTLLTDDHPLIILPTLATIIGLNECIFLQQLHYWLEKSNHHKDGHAWVYNTYENWNKQFPFWSESTIRRLVKNLELKNLIISNTSNNRRFDQTKWYTICYEKLCELIGETSDKETDMEQSNMDSSPVLIENNTTNLSNSPVLIKSEPTNLNNSPALIESEPSNLNNSPALIKSEPTNLNNSPALIESEPSNLNNSPALIESEPTNLNNSSALIENSPSIPNSSPAQSEQLKQCSLNKPIPEITSEITAKTPYHFFETNFGIINNFISEQITTWIHDTSEEIVLYAMQQARKRNARNWKYVERILQTWNLKKLTSITEIQANEQKFKQKGVCHEAHQKSPNQSTNRRQRLATKTGNTMPHCDF